MRFLLLSNRAPTTISGSSTIGFGESGEARVSGSIGNLALAECPPCVLTASNGTLLVATGFGPVKRMRLNERTLSNAGVPRPANAPVIKSSADQNGSATIATTRTQRFDYVQFGAVYAVFNGDMGVGVKPTTPGRKSLERRQGDYYKYKDLAASLSGEAAYQKKLRLIELFTGTTRLQPGGIPTTRDVWNHLVFDLQVVDESTINGAPGVGVITGRYQAFVRYVDKDGYFSDPSNISADAVLTAEPYVQYANLPVPSDPRVVLRQIWRNDNGQSDTFWLDIETDDLTSSELRSYHTDAQLRLSLPMPLFDSDGFSLAYLYGEPAYDKPYLAEYVSRIWAVGTIVYSTGNATVTNGSATVTGVGTAWTEFLAGRKFVAGGKEYLVLACDEDAQTLTIDPPYLGSSDVFADYTLRSYDGETNEIYFSGAGQPESFPADNRLSLPQDGDEVTGALTFNEALYVLKTRHLYRITAGADPKRDADLKLAAMRGCVSYRCAVPVGGMVFMLDRQGIHAFSGGASPEQVSTPVADLFRAEGTWRRLNWNSDTCLWHGTHMEEQGFVRFYVAMGSDAQPHNAICIDYRRGRLWVEDYPTAITSSTLTNEPSLQGRPLLGAADGTLLTCDLGPLDFLAAPADSRLAVTSAGPMSVTTTTAPPADSEGYPLAIVEGPGRGQLRTIASIVGLEIQVDLPWNEQPTSESVVQVGAINYSAISKEHTLTKTEGSVTQAIKFGFKPVADDLTLFVALRLDGFFYLTNKATSKWGAVQAKADQEPEFRQIDLSEPTGYGRINFDRKADADLVRHARVQVEMEGFSGEQKPVLSQIEYIGATD